MGIKIHEHHMTTFIDGPATGQHLYLKRAPTFLRVTYDPRALTWDALDLAEDAPREGEQVHVYILMQEPGRCHILKRPKGGGYAGSGWYVVATYAICKTQPSSIHTFDNTAWHNWVLTHKHLCPIPGAEIPAHLR
jgi:hypothetical protein